MNHCLVRQQQQWHLRKFEKEISKFFTLAILDFFKAMNLLICIRWNVSFKSSFPCIASTFTFPDFLAEVQENARDVLHAYLKVLHN